MLLGRLSLQQRKRMIYLLINLFSIELGGLLSRPAKRLLRPELTEAMRLGAGLCVLLLGIKGAVATKHELLMLLSIVLGGLLGTVLDLQGLFYRLGDYFRNKLAADDKHFTKGFISLFLMQAVGAMSIMGPMNVALQNDPTLLLFKALLDFVSTLVYGTIYGWGVLLCGPLLFLYEGLFFLLAGAIAPFLSAAMIAEIGAVGSLIILALGLDMLGLLEFKSANYLPAMFGPVLYFLLAPLF